MLMGGLANRHRIEIENVHSNHGLLSCILFNARSLKNKLPDLHHLLYSFKYHAIFITETWLQDSFLDSLLDPEGLYNIIRTDRNPGNGGGVCIMLQKNIDYKIQPVEINDLETSVLDIFTSNKLRLIVVYRKPTYDAAGKLYAENLIKYLTHVTNVNWPVLLTGDFNCPLIDWKLLTAPRDGIQNVLLDFVCDFGFDQLVTEPTRGENIVDLVFTNHPLLLSGIEIGEPFGANKSSDHNIINFAVDISVEHDVPYSYGVVKCYQWDKADYDAINNYIMNIDWNVFMSVNLTVEALWSSFKDVLYTAFDLFVPVIFKDNTSSINGKCNRAAKKYPSHIRKQLNKKRMLWRNCRSQPLNNIVKQKYLKKQIDCRHLLYNYELENEKRIIESGNSGRFYKYVNKKLSRPSGVGSLLDKDCKLLSDNLAKANLLNNYFASVCTVDDGTLPEFDNRVSENVFIDTVCFKPEIVFRCIRMLKPKSSAGPDGIPTRVLKKLASSISLPLSELFTSFMSVCKVPSEWKTAIVTPLFKKGQPSQCSNYRPISLTCCVCKLMERIIVLELSNYLRVNNLITDEQHGFLTKRSTTTNLLDTLNEWTVALSNKHLISVVYIDFSKAFDTVCHAKLIHKIKAYGICGQLLKWIEDWLSNRIQFTRVGTTYSTFATLTSGVIQGSCLGPLLFLLYINDIVSVLHGSARCKLFADDVKLYCCIDVDTDSIMMQCNIDAIIQWSALWQLIISENKCLSLLAGNKIVCLPPYKLYNNTVAISSCTRDLGVIINSRLQYVEHINEITAKARQKLGLIFKCFTTRDPATLKNAYTAYVRPILEYASPVWNPVYVGLIDKLESVQRNFTKRIYSLCKLSYSERLSDMGLESLQQRRLKADLIMAYKIIFGYTNLNITDYFVLRVCSSTRGHTHKLVPETSHTNCRLHFFSLRVTNAWNNLPSHIVKFDDLNVFKSSLDNIDFSKFVFY